MKLEFISKEIKNRYISIGGELNKSFTVGGLINGYFDGDYFRVAQVSAGSCRDSFFHSFQEKIIVDRIIKQNSLEFFIRLGSINYEKKAKEIINNFSKYTKLPYFDSVKFELISFLLEEEEQYIDFKKGLITKVTNKPIHLLKITWPIELLTDFTLLWMFSDRIRVESGLGSIGGTTYNSLFHKIFPLLETEFLTVYNKIDDVESTFKYLNLFSRPNNAFTPTYYNGFLSIKGAIENCDLNYAEMQRSGYKGLVINLKRDIKNLKEVHPNMDIFALWPLFSSINYSKIMEVIK